MPELTPEMKRAAIAQLNAGDYHVGCPCPTCEEECSSSVPRAMAEAGELCLMCKEMGHS